MKKRILLVGHTDTVLTPLCAAVLNCMCQKKGLENITVDHCGFWAADGHSVSPFTLAVAGELGIDLAKDCARYVSEEMTDAADWIIPQDEMIARGLREFLYRDMTKVGKPAKLKKPMAETLGAYRAMREEVLAYCERLMRKIMTEIREKKKLAAQIILRPVKLEEAAEVCRLEEACFVHPWTKEAVESELTKENGCFVGAYYKDTMIGYGSLYLVCGVAYINNIAVDKTYREIGIGDRILEELEEYCKEHKAENITLEVRSENRAAIGLYQKHGFRLCGRRRNFYRDPPDDGLIMTKVL